MHQRTASSGRPEVQELSDASDSDVFELERLHVRGMPSTGPGSQALTTGDDEEKEQPHRSVRSVVSIRAVVSLLLWYMFSISLSVYNKNMFSPKGLDFRFPVLTTAIHQLMQIVLALLYLSIARISVTLGSMTERFRILPAALASAGDIGLGNMSLLVVTLSFYTMVKSSALGFVLLFSVLFRIESPSWMLAGIIGVMTIGVFMMVAGETDFSLVGFILVIGASCASGLRWALIKLLLSGGQKDTNTRHHGPPAKKPHPVQTILAVSPGIFVVLLVLGCLIEGPIRFCTASMWVNNSLLLGLFYVTLPGALAFCMTWAEFELLNATGPLTLSIGGICKEVATILVSIVAFHDRLTFINSCGVVVTIIAIAMYHYYRLNGN